MSDLPAAANAPTVTVGGKPLPLAEAQRIVKGSGTWFWWIAALSAINSIAAMLDLKYGMVLGLGLGQLVDGLFFFGLDGIRAEPAPVARLIHLLLSALVAGAFVALGYFARKFNLTAFVVGMILYAVDALLFVVVGDWIGVGFHAFVLFMLWGGLSVLRAIRAQAGAEATAAV
jgi:hypothetical protein